MLIIFVDVDAELVPIDLVAQSPEGGEVTNFFVAGGNAVDVHEAEHVFDQIGFQSCVVGRYTNAELFEHLVAVCDANHAGQARVFDRFADLACFVGQSGGNLNAGAGKNAVDGIVDVVTGITQRTGIRRGHHAGRHGATTCIHHQKCAGVGGSCEPALLPSVELGKAAADCLPKVGIDALEQLLYSIMMMSCSRILMPVSSWNSRGAVILGSSDGLQWPPGNALTPVSPRVIMTVLSLPSRPTPSTTGSAQRFGPYAQYAPGPSIAMPAAKSCSA